MDRLNAMALLVKVTELGSMSAAARALNMPLKMCIRDSNEAWERMVKGDVKYRFVIDSATLAG